MSKQNDENKTISQKEDFIPVISEDKPEVLAEEGAPQSQDGQEENTDMQNSEAKAAFGKFKNPSELLRAYGELEKEFTRRSQRLRELENNVKPYESEEEWREAADKFFTKTPSAVPFAREIAQEISSDPQLREDRNCFEKALVSVMARNFRTPEQLMQDGQFLKEYVLASPKVREEIINEYLDALLKAQPPRTFAGGGLQSVAPPSKPRTLEEAGRLFLKDNK